MTAKAAEWTKENIQKLLASLRNNIPAEEKSSKYSEGLKAINWDKVAFYPFSALRCRKKWNTIMHDVRKVRTLEELITVAENKVKPTVEKKGHKKGEDGIPHKPPGNGYILFCNEKQKSVPAGSKRGRVYTNLKMWKDLTVEQRGEYSNRCIKLWKEYRFPKNLKAPERRKSKVSRFKGEPEMPARTCYTTFFQEQLKIHEGNLSNSRACFTDVSKKWMDLPDTKKKACKERTQRNMKNYSNKLREWFEKLSPAEQEDFLLCNPKKKQYLDPKETQVSDKDHPRHKPLDSDDEDSESSSSSSVGFVYSEGEELEGDGQGDIFEFF